DPPPLETQMLHTPVGVTQHRLVTVALGAQSPAREVIDPPGPVAGSLEVEDLAVRLGIEGRAALEVPETAYVARIPPPHGDELGPTERDRPPAVWLNRVAPLGPLEESFDGGEPMPQRRRAQYDRRAGIPAGAQPGEHLAHARQALPVVRQVRVRVGRWAGL